MKYFTARRILDGFLLPPQASSELKLTPEARQAVINNAIVAYGGLAAAWEFLELSEVQFNAYIPGDSAFLSVGGEITHQHNLSPAFALDQLARFQRGRNVHTGITDIRKRKVKRLW